MTWYVVGLVLQKKRKTEEEETIEKKLKEETSCRQHFFQRGKREGQEKESWATNSKHQTVNKKRKQET